MDGELIFWMLFFVGGYCLVLALLLRVAFRAKPDPGTVPDSEVRDGSP